jgi:hypothetical protein
MARGGGELLRRDFHTIFPPVGASKKLAAQDVCYRPRVAALNISKQQTHDLLLLGGERVSCAHEEGI